MGERFSALAHDEADIEDVENAMGLNDLGGPGGFLSRVEVLYRALVLDSRALVVGGAEAGLTDPRGSVEHFHRDLEHRLAANTKHLQRLRTRLLDASSIRVECGLYSWPATVRRVVRTQLLFADLARAVVEPPPSPALLTPTNQLVIEAQRHADGNWQVRQPDTLAA